MSVVNVSFMGTNDDLAILEEYTTLDAQVWWNYAPLGHNLCNDAPATRGDHSGLYTTLGVGPSYMKARYIEYTDASFSVRKKRQPAAFVLAFVIVC